MTLVDAPMIPAWRNATADDLDAVNRIADAIHVGLPERPEVFAEKFSLFPEGCFCLVQGDRVLGYGFSHPWMLHSVPALDTFLEKLPADSECLFLHDVVVLPEARGRGAAGKLIQMLDAIARERAIKNLALVSVYDTHPLWSKFGFEIVSNPALAEKIKSYGDTAKYMVRRIDGVR